MNRRILIILVGDEVEQPQWAVMPRSMPVVAVIEEMLRPELRMAENTKQWSASAFRLFDWSGQVLPADIDVGAVPLPGIVLAVHPEGDAGLSGSVESDIWLFRHSIMRDEVGADRLSRFLSSPDASVRPAPLKRLDVFISYAFEDGALAAAVLGHLQSRGLEVFMAESSLNSSRQWREQILDALSTSRCAVLLITEASVHSTWVLAEAGAIASQRTPAFVLYDGMEETGIPAPLRDAAATAPARAPARWLDAVERRVRRDDGEQTG